MAEAITRRAPLAHLGQATLGSGADGEPLYVLPRKGRVYLHLRMQPDDAAALAAGERALGTALPSQPNTLATWPGGEIAWLAPAEWFIDTDETQSQSIAAALERTAADQLMAVTDLSDGRCGLEIGGRHATDLLRKGCPLDLHPHRFGPGQCARSLLAKAQVLLWPLRTKLAPAYRLVVDRSYADYLWRWLADAAREYLAREPTAPSPDMHHHTAPPSPSRRTP